MPGVPGITSIADVLRPPHIAMLSIGAARRAPVEGADGSVKFIDMMTVTLSCDHRAIDAARGAELLVDIQGLRRAAGDDDRLICMGVVLAWINR